MDKNNDQKSDKYILEVLDNIEVLSRIESMTVKECLEYLDGSKHWDLSQIIAIAIIIFDIMKSKKLGPLNSAEEDMEICELKFRHNYNITVDELWTLRMIAEGKTDEQIGNLDQISAEAVRKRVKQILKKTGCSNRVQAAVKATKEGVI